MHYMCASCIHYLCGPVDAEARRGEARQGKFLDSIDSGRSHFGGRGGREHANASLLGAGTLNPGRETPYSRSFQRVKQTPTTNYIGDPTKNPKCSFEHNCIV